VFAPRCLLLEVGPEDHGFQTGALDPSKQHAPLPCIGTLGGTQPPTTSAGGVLASMYPAGSERG
jgi:hypothetical protein